MPKVKLTAKTVENAKPPAPGTRLELFDATLPGFGLRVGDSNKSWFVFYRFAGKQKRLTLGHFPAVTLGEARDKASLALRQVDEGIDPAEEKQAGKAKAKAAQEHKALTGYALGSFGELAALYIKQECPLLRRGKNVAGIVNKDILPPWKDRAVTDLRRKDLTVLLDPMIVAGQIQKAHKVREIIIRIINWSIDRGDLEANLLASPSRGRKRSGILQRHHRDRVLSDDELRAVWVACEELSGPFPAIVKTLILTGQRRDEVSCMRRSELDLDGGVWTIPADRYKTGIVHVIPLVKEVVDIIRNQPKVSDEFVFTTVPDGGFSGYSWAKVQLDKKVSELQQKGGKPDLPPWTLHDLRRTLRTGLSSLGVGGDISERVVGHVIGGVRGIYDRHAYLAEKQDALERWAAHVRAIINPPPDNVVQLQPVTKHA